LCFTDETNKVETVIVWEYIATSRMQSSPDRFLESLQRTFNYLEIKYEKRFHLPSSNRIRHDSCALVMNGKSLNRYKYLSQAASAELLRQCELALRVALRAGLRI